MIWHGGGYGIAVNPNFVFQYYQDGFAPAPAWEVTTGALNQIRLLNGAIESFSDSYKDIARAVQMFESLKILPRQSEFQVLGLFGIIELLITHAPRAAEIGDSIRHQVRTKIPLLARHSGQHIDYKAFFPGCTEDKAWDLLYNYRSRLAHGGEPNFVGSLKLLKDRGTALRFLRYATKCLIRYALQEPQQSIPIQV